MSENIGWLYYKQYYETEEGTLVAPKQLEKKNANLITKRYDRSYLVFLRTGWNEVNEHYSNFVLRVC